MATMIQFRRGESSSWQSENPVLASGEMVLETDTKQVKLGNGTSNYNSLPYAFTQGEPTNIFVAFF
jgi:hypothetical protein